MVQAASFIVKGGNNLPKCKDADIAGAKSEDSETNMNALFMKGEAYNSAPNFNILKTW